MSGGDEAGDCLVSSKRFAQILSQHGKKKDTHTHKRGKSKWLAISSRPAAMLLFAADIACKDKDK
jgi:hypothetical protein